MNRITAGARSRFGYLFGYTAAKPVLAAKVKARPVQPRPIATKPASSKPTAPCPADFSHLLKASRARDVEMPAFITTMPKPRSLGERHRAYLRSRGEAVSEPVDALPEQPTRRKNKGQTLGERIAAVHKQMGRI